MSFAEFWAALYPDSPPLSHLMRTPERQNWIRFHSRLSSKQYPEDEAEKSVLLDRQNKLASFVLGENHPCWIVQACWSSPEGSVNAEYEAEQFLESHKFGLKHVLSYRDETDEPDDPVWHFMAAELRWTSAAFDSVLSRIAHERAAPTLWVSAENGGVFAPYAGGVDLFLQSKAAVVESKLAHADWLPIHPGGPPASGF